MRDWILAFSKLLDDTYAVRRGYLVFAGFLTWETLHWAMRFAETHPTMDAAALIGAVSAVVAALQAFAFRDYLTSKP